MFQIECTACDISLKKTQQLSHDIKKILKLSKTCFFLSVISFVIIISKSGNGQGTWMEMVCSFRLKFALLQQRALHAGIIFFKISTYTTIFLITPSTLIQDNQTRLCFEKEVNTTGYFQNYMYIYI